MWHYTPLHLFDDTVVQASGEKVNWCCFILDNCLVKLTVHSFVLKIGDSYCVSETELESILTFHKQQTQSVWGTRQSPSPAKPATRLMWKSQYVPYDGIPFVNAGTPHQYLQTPQYLCSIVNTWFLCESIHCILVGKNFILIAENEY